MLRLPLLLMLLLSVAACTVSPPNLNSDRIKLKYGSYQVRVLYQDEQWRVSSLESRHEYGSVTRTLALVQYEPVEHPEIAAVDQRIRDGGSIGREFRLAGWKIAKPAIFVGEVKVPLATSTVARLMNITLPQELAAHAYRFEVSRDGERHTYATIIELHHPDFMSKTALRRYYTPPRNNDSAGDAIEIAVRLLIHLPDMLAH